MIIKKCKCGNEYTKHTTMQTCCIPCLAEKVAKNRIKTEKSVLQSKKRELIKEKKANKARLLELEPLSYFKGKAQDALNKWIVHVRDKGLPCVSCGKENVPMQAGHYLARSIRPELALTESNLAAQCVYCNLYSKNGHIAYRQELIRRIGIELVDWLESPHPPAKWTREDLIEIERFYKEKLKILKESV